MSENLEDNEPRIIPPGSRQYAERSMSSPLIGTEHAPPRGTLRVQRSGRIRVAFFRCRHSRASGTSP